LQESELDYFDIKQMSPFCHYYRTSNPDFESKCIECDRKHLLTSKRTGNVHVYHCHSGLLEGIIPLYDRHKIYLGAIVFGQLRDRDVEYKYGSKKEKELLERTRFLSMQEVRDIGELLKHIGEYIIENEIIKYKNKPWAELVEDYINDHLNEKLPLERMAKYIDRSPSFISQNFPKEFGMPLKSYILKQKMKRAKELLEGGKSVKQTAFELGFYDEFHFSKKFKSCYGKPPVTFKL
jgi:YesN/AraC family two-component response regulator